MELALALLAAYALLNIWEAVKILREFHVQGKRMLRHFLSENYERARGRPPGILFKLFAYFFLCLVAFLAFFCQLAFTAAVFQPGLNHIRWRLKKSVFNAVAHFRHKDSP